MFLIPVDLNLSLEALIEQLELFLLPGLALLDERKAFPIGTKRTWGRGVYKKTKKGWVRLSSKKAGKPKNRTSNSTQQSAKTAPKTVASPSKEIALQAAIAAIDEEKRRPLAKSYPKGFKLGDYASDPDFPKKKQRFERSVSKLLGKSITLEEIANGFSPPKGVQAKLMHIGEEMGGGEQIAWQLLNSAGEEIGFLNRSFGRSKGKSYVKHNNLHIEREYQGEGISDTINGNAFRRYEKWGVDQVKIEAADAGKYAWARLGFTFDDPEQTLDAFHTYVGTMPELANQKEKLIPIAQELVKEPWKLAKWDIGVELPDEYNKAKPKIPLGKAFLLSNVNNPWDGHMPVDRKNEGYLTAIAKSKVAV